MVSASRPKSNVRLCSRTAPRRRRRKSRSLLQRALRQRLPIYQQLMRTDRPIGTLLVLWPTLWSLWIAAAGIPSFKNLFIFSTGAFLMRSAGCVINDVADRKIDGQVARTQNRPFATGRASTTEAILLFIALCLLAFALVLFTNTLTIQLSFVAVALAFCYPFVKRFSFLPQVVLGMAFAMSVPMAFAAETGHLSADIWLIYTAVVLWTVAYDTFYAMVDREDDLRIGVKSTAILFADMDRVAIASLQVLALLALLLAGQKFELGLFYQLGLAAAAALFGWQQFLTRHRQRAACFHAFLNNNWVGVVIFIGIVAHYVVKAQG